MTTVDWSYLVAFVGTPGLVVLIGYVAVRLHERADDRKHHPAE